MGGGRALRGVGLVLLLGLGGVAPGLAEEPKAGEQQAEPKEAGPTDGAFLAAPSGCWTMRGACPARTRAVQTPSVTGALEPAWRLAAGAAPLSGRLDGEPLLWHDRLYVQTRAVDGSLAIHALRLEDAEPLGPPFPLPGVTRWEPAVWEDLVLAPVSRTEVALVQLVAGRWHVAWGPVPHDADDPALLAWPYVVTRVKGLMEWSNVLRVGPPVALGVRVYGHQAASGEAVYGLTYDAAGNCYLRTDDLAHGLHLTDLVGHHGTGRPPAEAAESRVSAFDHLIVVDHGAPVVAARPGVSLRTAIWHAPDSSYPSVSAGLFDHLAPGARVGGGLVVRRQGPHGQSLDLLKAYRPSELRYQTLATPKRRPELLTPTLLPAACPDAFWIGGTGVSLPRHRLLDAAVPRIEALLTIPGHECLLTADEAGSLTCWREAGRPRHGPQFLGRAREAARAGGEAARIEPLRALLHDGTVLTKGAALDPAGGALVLTQGRKETRVPLAAVAVVTEPGGELLYTSTLAGTAGALARLARLEQGAALLALATKVQAWSNAEALERVLAAARRAGAEAKRLAALQKRLGTLPFGGRKPVPAERQRELEEALAGFDREAAPIVRRGLESGLAAAEPAVRRFFLLDALARDPNHPIAREMVRASIPAYIAPGEPFDPREWLDVHTTFSGIPIEQVTPPQGEAPDLSPAQRELGAALHYWRPDLLGLKSPRLMIITPARQPRALAACLSLGELVCSALDETFTGPERRRESRWPLLLQLFESRKEYQGLALPGADPHGAREWSAGHYDVQANLTRIWLPEGEDPDERLLATYAHELAHHWFQVRCPLYAEREAQAALTSGPRALWLVEGLATFVESWIFEPGPGVYDTFNLRSDHLDVVANAPASVLLPWASVVDASGADFHGLSRKPVAEIPSTWELLAVRQPTPLHLFYEQSALLCAYLFHAGEQTRAALMEHVREVYTGKALAKDGSFERRFGMAPEALGAAASAWARDLIARRIPPPANTRHRVGGP